MKKILLGTILFVLPIAAPIPTLAGVEVGVHISLPAPIVFAAPPAVIVLPDTNDVYVAPDVDVDLFFWNGWWWRPWEGGWYRSRYYDRGWVYYSHVPSFYFDVDPGWRGYYRHHDWYGRRWNYERIPNQRLQKNWKTWHNDRHWEGQRTWGVQNYHPRTQPQRKELRHQREQEYQHRPEVQRHQQQTREQQKQHQGQQSRQQSQERVHQQKGEKRPQDQKPQHSQPQDEPEGGRR
jgi:hypothetical protein